MQQPEMKINEYGDTYWYLNGELHRTDGPAYEGDNGYKAWYLNGKRYSEEEWKKICMELEIKDVTC